MHHSYKMIRSCIRTNPELLLNITDKKLLSYIDSFLPYSVGFEIECSPKLEYPRRTQHVMIKDLIVVSLPDLLDVQITENEQRFRIPAGLKGLVSLYKLTSYLKEFLGLNHSSGIHYHVDFTDAPEIFINHVWLYIKANRIEYQRTYDIEFEKCYHSRMLKEDRFMQENTSWILDSLKHWNYTGRYNEHSVSFHKTQVRFHSTYNTVEFRIGEMTFDYELLVKRIINCCNISKKIKQQLKKGGF